MAKHKPLSACPTRQCSNSKDALSTHHTFGRPNLRVEASEIASPNITHASIVDVDIF